MACGVWLLGRGWTVGPVTRRDFAGFDKQILSPSFMVELGDRSRDTFAAKMEKEAKEIVGPTAEHELRGVYSCSEATFT